MKFKLIAYILAVLLVAGFLYWFIAKEFGKSKATINKLKQTERTDKRAIDSISSHLRKALLRNEAMANQIEIMSVMQNKQAKLVSNLTHENDNLKRGVFAPMSDSTLNKQLSAIR